MKPKHWLVFILLGAVWSSSFLWIKIAVQEIGLFTLVGFRVLFGLVATLAIAAFARSQWPRERATWLMLMLLGITNTAVPFVLISWGEIYIDSAVASILNSTIPLFTILIAHYFLHDDKMSLPKVLGSILGFVGVLLLLSKDLIAASHTSVLGQAAVLIASLFYRVGLRRRQFGLRTTYDAGYSGIHPRCHPLSGCQPGGLATGAHCRWRPLCPAAVAHHLGGAALAGSARLVRCAADVVLFAPPSRPSARSARPAPRWSPTLFRSAA